MLRIVNAHTLESFFNMLTDVISAGQVLQQMLEDGEIRPETMDEVQNKLVDAEKWLFIELNDMVAKNYIATMNDEEKAELCKAAGVGIEEFSSTFVGAEHPERPVEMGDSLAGLLAKLDQCVDDLNELSIEDK